jgi:hypothetical protein
MLFLNNTVFIYADKYKCYLMIKSQFVEINTAGTTETPADLALFDQPTYNVQSISNI